MDKQTVVKIIGEQRMVEEIISSIAGNNDSDLQDLAQSLYLNLLEKDEETIVNLFNNKQLKFFIVKMVTNNLRSKTSPFYIQYRKFKNLSTNIDDIKDKL